MTSDDLTAILYKKDDLRLEQKKPREPGSGEVNMQTKLSVGLLGKSLHEMHCRS